jgi:hypothetical protein
VDAVFLSAEARQGMARGHGRASFRPLTRLNVALPTVARHFNATASEAS